VRCIFTDNLDMGPNSKFVHPREGSRICCAVRLMHLLKWKWCTYPKVDAPIQLPIPLLHQPWMKFVDTLFL
jgi:hypothetical protein